MRQWGCLFMLTNYVMHRCLLKPRSIHSIFVFSLLSASFCKTPYYSINFVFQFFLTKAKPWYIFTNIRFPRTTSILDRFSQETAVSSTIFWFGLVCTLGSIFRNLLRILHYKLCLMTICHKPPLTEIKRSKRINWVISKSAMVINDIENATLQDLLLAYSFITPLHVHKQMGNEIFSSIFLIA